MRLQLLELQIPIVEVAYLLHEAYFQVVLFFFFFAGIKLFGVIAHQTDYSKNTELGKKKYMLLNTFLKLKYSSFLFFFSFFFFFTG